MFLRICFGCSRQKTQDNNGLKKGGVIISVSCRGVSSRHGRSWYEGMMSVCHPENMTFSLHGLIWLLVLQPLYLHFIQEEERKKGMPFLIRTFLEYCAPYFCLHPIGRNVITWSQGGCYMTIRNPRKCSLYIRWPDSQLKISNSQTQDKGKIKYGIHSCPASPRS